MRYAHVKYVKSLFINIQKQWNMLKLDYFLRNLRTSWGNSSRILGIKNTKFSGYCFHMKTNIQRDFQICITLPLISIHNANKNLFWSFFQDNVRVILLLNYEKGIKIVDRKFLESEPFSQKFLPRNIEKNIAKVFLSSCMTAPCRVRFIEPSLAI